MKDLPVKEIKLVAGEQQDGRPVVESVPVVEHAAGQFQLLQSPGFVRGLARGDLIRFDQNSGSHTVLKRSGNLNIRVIARDHIEALAAALVPELEKLGGTLDFSNERMLVFSIHVSCGFQAIEAILDRYTADSPEAIWMYGNVYHMERGDLVPMNWWQEILAPE